MQTLSPPAWGLAILLLIGLLSLGANSAHAGPVASGPDLARHQLLPSAQDPDDDDDSVEDQLDPQPSNPDAVPAVQPDITSPGQDSDGDGLPNIQDPDDDNAGVSDQDDPAPFDPKVEPPPPSNPLSPVHDDDGDGLPNIQDPDDDNDSLSDDEDPGAPEPAADPVGAPDAALASSGNAAVGGGGAPVVTALPSTGSEPDVSTTAAFALLLVGAGVLSLALSLRLRWLGTS